MALDDAHGKIVATSGAAEQHALDERHLARAYLAGIASAIDHTPAGEHAEARVFEHNERVRLLPKRGAMCDSKIPSVRERRGLTRRKPF
jgi:hypothetical protein